MNKRLIASLAITLSLLFGSSAHSSTLSTAITKDGLDWAQLHYSSEWEMFNLCGLAGNTCKGLTSRGVDLTGWTWATHSESVKLVNSVLGVNFVGGELGEKIYTDTSLWFDHFDKTEAEAHAIITIGFTSDVFSVSDFNNPHEETHPTGGALGTVVILESIPNPPAPPTLHGVIQARPWSSDLPRLHYYFLHRPSEVPIPAAAFMFAPALLGFMGLRRKAKNTAV